MAHAGTDDDRNTPAITGINVTPLVDVTLVLLIVFMVTAKVIASQAIPMQLPAASTAGAVEMTLAVGVASDGSLTLDGAPMADGKALERAAKARAGSDPTSARAVVAASRTSTHGNVVTAIDALRSAGVTKIAFAVERKQ